MVPLPGTAELALFAELGAGRRRPRRPGRRPAGGDGRARRPARRRCAGGSTSSCRRACGRWAPSARRRSRPGPPSAGRSTPRSPPSRSSRGCWRATGWPAATTVCLVAEPRRTSPCRPCAPAVTTLALHGLPAGARARPRAAARRRGGVGGPAGGRAGRRPGRPRRGRAGAPGARARRPARRTSTSWPACCDGFAPAGRPTAPGAPAAERHEGAWQLTVPLPFAERGAAAPDPLGRRPRGQRRRRPPVDPARRAAAPLRGDRRPAGRPRHARRPPRGRLPARSAALARRSPRR